MFLVELNFYKIGKVNSNIVVHSNKAVVRIMDIILSVSAIINLLIEPGLRRLIIYNILCF